MGKNYAAVLQKFKISNNHLLFLFLLFTFILSGGTTYAQDCSVNAGNSRAICANSPVVFNAEANGNIVSFKWTQIAGPSVVIQNPNAINSAVLGTVGGNTYTFRLSAICKDKNSTFQDVTFFIDPITISNAGAAIEGCPGTYALSANAPTNPGETGLWTVSGPNSGGVTINDPTSATSTVTLSSAAAGTTQLVWTITSPSYSHPTLNPNTNSCTSTSSVNVINYGGEQTANAGPDQTLSECYTATQGTVLDASIGGNGTGGQVGTWSFVSGPAVPTIANPSNPATGVTNLIEGSYVFRWSVQGPCTMGTDTVTINVPPATQEVTNASGTNFNQRFCDPSILSTVLEGNTPRFAGETVLWTTNAPGVTIESPNSPTTVVSGLNFPNTTNYTFTYTIFGNSDVNPNCSDSRNFTVRYSPENTTISLNGGVDTVYLPVNDTSGSVPITVSGGTSYQAIFVNGPITPAQSDLTFSSGNFNFSGLTTAGTYTFRVRRFTGGSYGTGCSEAFADINVVVSFSPATANAGTSVALACGVKRTQLSGNDPATLSPPGLSGFWSQVSGPNTALFDDFNINNPEITGLVSGIYVFRWNLYGGPDAVNTFSEASITVSEPPVSVAGTTPVTVCAGSYAFNAQALVPGQTGLWTQTDSNTAVVFDDATNPTTFVTGLETSKTYNFTWTVSGAANSGCEPNSSAVVVNTTANLSPSPAVAGSDICLSSGTTMTSLAATAPLVGTGTWTQVDANPAVTFAAVNSATTSISGLTDGGISSDGLLQLILLYALLSPILSTLPLQQYLHQPQDLIKMFVPIALVMRCK